jgi:hypothetical protein
MDINKYFKRVLKKFKNDYETLKFHDFELKEISIAGINTNVASFSEFRWSWLGGQCIFFFFSKVKKIDKATIKNFSEKSLEYSYKNRQVHGKRCVSIAMLTSLDIESDAKEFCKNKPKIHYYKTEIPIIYDPKEDKLIYSKKFRLWGFLNYIGLQKYIKHYFGINE